MNCVVTAGPTYEPLDDVRRLTNFSTGRLGAELANFLVARGHRVTLLIGEMATYTGPRRAQQIEFYSTTADLRKKMKAVCRKGTDAILHAAAVSDFAFGKVRKRSSHGAWTVIRSGKISTRHGLLLAEMAPTPKILPELRGWLPAAKIVGWKYEVEGGRADALAAAQEQLVRCAADLCVVNGPAYGSGFGLLGKKGAPAHLADRLSLFGALEKFVRAP
ncbi:MAG: DNA/pantothenate metabolism flavoprotein domain protein [Verrucomicrobiota bacterium]|nr:DNA/pantothenate metabolism flavoprotein domain protein [Verrucomicrobiota bacterium]MDE3067871.1 DNA/pantothenate metabolism flavoprotein domain protein [Verrucomicrobiota bacterium]